MPRVLVADDEKVIQRLLKNALNELEFPVHIAGTHPFPVRSCAPATCDL
ncbi:MAG: hypothetical protein ACM3N7_06265 [Planctomycetaceae bacterium]